MHPITIDPHSGFVIFKKPFFDDTDFHLADALWLEYDTTVPKTEVNTISANILIVFRSAVDEFIQNVFTSFSTYASYENDRQALKKDLDDIYLLADQFKASKLATVVPWWDKLREHQRKAACDMLYRRVTLLSFEMRLGKTITGATMSVAWNVRLTVVVCMDIGKWSWLYDVTDKKWGQSIITEEMFTVISSRKHDSRDGFPEKFIMINYEQLPKAIDRLLTSPVLPGHIIFSEAQRVKNVDTATWKAAKKLVDACPNARITMETGTPVLNRSFDMFGYFRLINHPLGESKGAFKKNYSNIERRYGGVNGSRNINHLRACSSNFMIRRTQAECFDVPKEEFVMVYTPMHEIQPRYNQALRDLVRAKGKVNVERMIQSLNRLMAIAKVPGIIEQAELLAECGEKVIIFFGYTDPIDAVAKHFGDRCVVINGAVSGKDKSDRAQQFMTDPNIMFCVANMEAAGHTIDLSISQNVIFGSLPVSPKKMDQAISRTKNINVTKGTTVYIAMAKSSDGKMTVDERIYDLIRKKDHDINHLIDGVEGQAFDVNISERLHQDLIMDFQNLLSEDEKEGTINSEGYDDVSSDNDNELQDSADDGRSLLPTGEGLSERVGDKGFG